MLYPISEVRNFVTGLDHPEGLAVARDGTLYAGGEAGQVYRISSEGKKVEILANTRGFCLGITLDQKENIYICDCGRRSLIKVTQMGEVTVVADAADGADGIFGPRSDPDHPGSSSTFATEGNVDA